jgi:glycosyltransferase involved in cell wall biosynthesis
VRILRINSWDGPGTGGAEGYVRSVMDELEARGHPNLLINLTDVHPPGPLPDERYLAMVPMTSARARMRQDLGELPGLSSSLEEAVRSFRPDLIQLHHFEAGFTTVGRFLRNSGVPLLVTAHDAWLVCPIGTLVRPGAVICDGGIRWRCQFTGCDVGRGLPYSLWQKRLFDAWVAPRVRAYLCPSRSLMDYLDRHGYAPALHLPSFASIPPTVRSGAAPYPRGPPRVGWIGRLESYKGVEDLLRAFVRVLREFPEARLDLAGDGSARPALEALSERLRLGPAIRWWGRVRGPEKEDFFAGLRVLAVPSSQYENFPLVALEALARGRPVVGTAIGGIPEIVEDGRNGRIVPIQDPAALAEALLDVLRDPARAERWGAAGREKVLREVTPERHVTRLLAVYGAVLAGASLPSRMEAQALVPEEGVPARPPGAGP